MATIDEVLRALAGPGLSIAAAEQSASAAHPGLYAVHGIASVWAEIGLGPPPDQRPLYVGKAESNFQTRDLREHFATGTTGRSTLRRSVASLLARDLELTPVPRGSHPLDRTKRAHSFGLTPDSDARLTDWMRRHLTLSLWPCSEIKAIGGLETMAIAALKPPLCIDGKWKPNHWHKDVINPARKAMTAIVRAGAVR